MLPLFTLSNELINTNHIIKTSRLSRPVSSDVKRVPGFPGHGGLTKTVSDVLAAPAATVFSSVTSGLGQCASP